MYDNAKRLTGKNLSNGEKLRYTLDNAGRTIQTQTFDAQNNLASTESATYDGLNRITQRIDAQNKITAYTYDANGNVTAVTDPNNLTTTTQYDALNRPILITDPLGKTVATTYNTQNLITSVRDPNNNTTTYTYSGFGDNLQTQSPDTGLTTATYNAGSLPITKTDARGKTSSYTYDVLGRIITVAYNDTTTGTTMTYDIAQNGVGQLASVTDPAGTTSYTYDAYSRMISKATTINALNGAAAQTKTISYTRDNTGKVTSMTYPSGKVLALSYVQGRTNAMTLNAAPLISGIQYFPFGGPESWLLGSSTSTKEYTRIIDQSSRTQQYSTPNGFRTIQYDNASRIVGINNYTGATQATATLNGSQLFTYDNAGRLTTFSGYTSNGVNATTGLGNAAITQTQSFAYDNNGNRTNSTLNSIASTYSYQSGNNRLASVTGGIVKTNSYDATGNLTNDGSQSYTYDARGRLTGATVPANAAAPTTNYLINYQGLRVKKANANTATTTSNRTFIYDDGGKMLGEYDHTGNAIQELIWLGDTPIAVTGTMPCLTSTSGANGAATCTEAATAYIFTDHLNTPREIARINPAAPTINNGYTSLWKWDSLPFGETQANENPSNTGIFSFNHRFPGQYRDKETGLNQNWFRDYDSIIGRYVESDPIGLRGAWNTYEYVGSNPLRYVDPQGLLAVITCSPCGGGGMMSCGVVQDGTSIFTFTSNTGPNPSPLNPGTYSVTAGASSFLNISNNGTPGSVTTFDQKTGQVLNTKTNVQIHSEAITRTSNGCIIPASISPQTSQGTVSKLVQLEAANLNSGGTLLVIRAASCGN